MFYNSVMRKLRELFRRTKPEYVAPDLPERDEISAHPDVFASADIGGNSASGPDSEGKVAMEVEKGRRHSGGGTGAC